MKKEFINPEMEVLRFKKGADVLLISVMSTDHPADSHTSLSRGKHDDDDDDF